jgi:cobalt-precorrin-5B (C1)-methyltransferase
VANIGGITLARRLWEIIPENERVFFDRIVQECIENCAPLFRNGEGLEIVLLEEE